MDRTLTEDLAHALMPGLGRTWKEAVAQGLVPGLEGKPFEDRIQRRPRDWKDFLFEQPTGLRRSSMDFPRFRDDIERSAYFDMRDLEDRARSDFRDPNLTGAGRRRLSERLREDAEDVQETLRERRRRELPARR